LGNRKLLVRNSAFCKDKGQRTIFPVAKLEYFPKHGWEEITVREQVETWIKLKTEPPGSAVMLLRIHPSDKTILSVEEALAMAAPPPMNYTLFLDIIRLLESCHAGHYLLSHSTQQSRVVLHHHIDETTTGKKEKDAFDLHDEKTFGRKLPFSPAHDFIPWVWSDTNTIPYCFHVSYKKSHVHDHQRKKRKKKKRNVLNKSLN